MGELFGVMDEPRIQVTYRIPGAGNDQWRSKSATSVEGALDIAALCGGQYDTYIRCATLREDPGSPTVRGDASFSHEFAALWVDLDVAGPTRGNTRDLPPDSKVAEEIISRVSPGHPPSFVVDSGYGRHAWWLLSEPHTAEEFAPTLARWRRHVAAVAKPYKADTSVYSLDQMLRLPGSLNFKGGQPVPVRIIAGVA